MSLRDFNTPSTDDPIALHNEPLGNGSGLDSFHTTQPEDIEPNNTPKIIGAIAVALMIGTAGAALYATSGHSAKPVVTASNMPAPAAPAPVAAPPAPEAAAPADNMAAQAPLPDTKTPAAKPATEKTAAADAPVKTAKVHRSASSSTNVAVKTANSGSAGDASSARMAADSTQSTVQPQQQAAVTAQPVAPSPSPSDVASNNSQSSVTVPQGANRASDIPAQPAAPQESQQANNAPAQDQQSAAPAQPAPQAAAPAAQPAPAQSAGQVNQ